MDLHKINYDAPGGRGGGCKGGFSLVLRYVVTRKCSFDFIKRSSYKSMIILFDLLEDIRHIQFSVTDNNNSVHAASVRFPAANAIMM